MKGIILFSTVVGGVTSVISGVIVWATIAYIQAQLSFPPPPAVWELGVLIGIGVGLYILISEVRRERREQHAARGASKRGRTEPLVELNDGRPKEPNRAEAAVVAVVSGIFGGCLLFVIVILAVVGIAADLVISIDPNKPAWTFLFLACVVFVGLLAYRNVRRSGNIYGSKSNTPRP